MGISKQLLPIYDKPMVYYPISVLMLAGINEILVIAAPNDMENYRRLLGDGSQFGINLSYVVQPSPNGLAEAFILGSEFIGDSNVALVLGDNFFYGQAFSTILGRAVKQVEGATIFGYRVTDPERFGVVEFNEAGDVLSIEEKPANPKSNYAVTGLYFYNNDVVEIAKTISPSSNGELEITDINEVYRSKDMLTVEVLGRGFAWLDTGTFDSLLASGEFVQTIEKRQGLKVACLEEIGFNSGWLSEEDLISRAEKLSNSSYGEYLFKVISEGREIKI
tara:strand:- start:336 stop:1166 length:831 start_codon:yes stop_codon:yes gene_type:complete